MKAASPLRYPGGKWRLASFFSRLLALNDFSDFEYVEPYAGGASLALSLLLAKKVTRIHLNDLDPAIYAFWYCVLQRTREMLRLIGETPLTIPEWHRQKRIYSSGSSAGMLALGFATFYLNRTNHSGIMNAGVIGGKSQVGDWLIDARFNRLELQMRVERISRLKRSIRLYQDDATAFIQGRWFSPKTLIYFDPPYFQAGKELYLNAYDATAHREVSKVVGALPGRWVVSYDDVPSIRRLYKEYRSRRLQLLHTARSARIGNEVMFFSDDLRIPRKIQDK